MFTGEYVSCDNHMINSSFVQSYGFKNYKKVGHVFQQGTNNVIGLS